MPPRIAVQKFVEGWRNLRQTPQFVEGFAFDKPLSSKFVEKKIVEGSLKVIGSSLSYFCCFVDACSKWDNPGLPEKRFPPWITDPLPS